MNVLGAMIYMLKLVALICVPPAVVFAVNLVYMFAVWDVVLFPLWAYRVGLALGILWAAAVMYEVWVRAPWRYR